MLAVGGREENCPQELGWHALNVRKKSAGPDSVNGAMQNRCCCKHLRVPGSCEPSRVAAYHRP